MEHYPKTLNREVKALLIKEAKIIIQDLIKANKERREISPKELKRANLFIENT